MQYDQDKAATVRPAGPHQNPAVLFNFRLQNVEGGLIFTEPRLDRRRPVDFDRVQVAKNHPGRQGADIMGEKAVGHRRIQEHGADAAMEQTRVALVDAGAGKLRPDPLVLAHGEFQPQARKSLTAAMQRVP